MYVSFYYFSFFSWCILLFSLFVVFLQTIYFIPALSGSFTHAKLFLSFFLTKFFLVAKSAVEHSSSMRKSYDLSRRRETRARTATRKSSGQRKSSGAGQLSCHSSVSSREVRDKLHCSTTTRSRAAHPLMLWVASSGYEDCPCRLKAFLHSEFPLFHFLEVSVRRLLVRGHALWGPSALVR